MLYPPCLRLGLLVDSACVLGLIEVGEGERVKISLSNLFNYFSVSGDSKQKNNFLHKTWYFDHNSGGWGGGHFVVGTTQKYHFF